ncbi:MULTISPECIES: AEC family transporter [Variovorax]|uniref:AEC family transporter n=1 Tax=Variovorax TaxID=34072 RepID=UPI000869BC0B|nr:MULTISPECIES: AEC family transporter [Variovorax]MBN8757601.1 AEC family transporter [Variovorax sp.]ODU13256.1 MAG: transporter [Variovorax sp. SCN 67-85]ODV22054.1 MAG: transporter [Variovorax sp. SCN 67-20]OJZ07769.1 MAG: transporter [Variovorax sp. 67-131]UKI10618.1 AEC family transporter [Variovorax paradoxus]
MNSFVISSLLPVVLLIAAGYLAGRRRWIGGNAVKDLSNLIFLLLAPALLFRAMSTVHVEQLSLKPVAAYFIASGLLFAGTMALRGFNRTAAVIALANTYSNTVMIGIALIGLAYGEDGMVVLLTLISLHSLVLLTSATVVLELAVAREHAAAGDGTGKHSMARTVLRALRNAIIHPVPLPIMAGLLFAQTGLVMPEMIDKPIQLLGQAFGPVALVMVGITLALTPIGRHWRGALAQALVKNLLHPLLVAAIGWALGVRGIPLTVMVVAAALPIGANVFLFSQRYRTAEDLVTASVAVSTVLALGTLTLVMVWVQWLP